MADSVAELIEETWANHVKSIEGLKTYKTFEPDKVDRAQMPLLTMYFLLPEAVPSETGDGVHVGEDIDYRWEISLYISLADFETGQKKMRDLSQRVVANFREHRSDYDLHPAADLLTRALRRRNPPTPDDLMSYLRASWELQVSAAEIWLLSEA